MRIIEPSVEILTPIDGEAILKMLKSVGRTCYKSEDKIQEGSAEKFIFNIVKLGYEAVIEHYNITVKFICDRGVTHEIVRHRLASYCQESTRYCNYANDKFNGEITVIKPMFLEVGTDGWELWHDACAMAEKFYFDLLDFGCTPQEARVVLPNSLKTELVMTANIREFRHFFNLRCSKAAHPQMREVANMLLREFKERIPVLFDDIEGM